MEEYLDTTPIFTGCIYSLYQNEIKLRKPMILWHLSLVNIKNILNIDMSFNEFFIVKNILKLWKSFDE